MTNAAANPLFHVSLGDRDEWVVEVEWPDGTVEQISTFKNHSAAAHWMATASASWLGARLNISAEPRSVAKSARLAQ
jgi:hypothetical protein